MITSLRKKILTTALLFTALTVVHANADLLSCGVDLGAAGRTKQWAVFTLGNGVNSNVSMQNFANVTGDVGAAGTGNVSMQDSATIQGNLYYHTGGKLTKKNSAVITGQKFQNSTSDTLLNQAAIDAQNASDHAFALSVTPAYSSLTNVNLSGSQNITITGSGCVVLKLQNFTMQNNSTFTLAGAAGTSYIINVTSSFSLQNNAKIVLGAGINPADVLFNVRGAGTVNLQDNTQFKGILLATKRSVTIQNYAQVTGEVIANSVAIKDNAKVTAVTPTTNH